MTDTHEPITTTPPADALHGVRAAAYRVFRVLAVLAAVAAVIQFALAGLGAFGASFDAHRTLGNFFPILPLLMLIVVLIARPGWVPIVLTVVLLLLSAAVQPLFATLGDDSSAWFGGLHALNGLVIMGLSGRLASGAPRAAPGSRP